MRGSARRNGRKERHRRSRQRGWSHCALGSGSITSRCWSACFAWWDFCCVTASSSWSRRVPCWRLARHLPGCDWLSLRAPRKVLFFSFFFFLSFRPWHGTAVRNGPSNPDRRAAASRDRPPGCFMFFFCRTAQATCNGSWERHRQADLTRWAAHNAQAIGCSYLGITDFEALCRTTHPPGRHDDAFYSFSGAGLDGGASGSWWMASITDLIHGNAPSREEGAGYFFFRLRVYFPCFQHLHTDLRWHYAVRIQASWNWRVVRDLNKFLDASINKSGKHDSLGGSWKSDSGLSRTPNSMQSGSLDLSSRHRSDAGLMTPHSPVPEDQR